MLNAGNWTDYQSQRMVEAMTDPTLQTVLRGSVLAVARHAPYQRHDAGRGCRVTPTRAGQALLALERAGLVDASRARLTMRGLVAAARLGAAGGGGIVERRARTQRPRARRGQAKPVPWAAESERPEPLPAAPCF